SGAPFAGIEVVTMGVQIAADCNLECGDMSPISDWQTCLPVPKRSHACALQMRAPSQSARYADFPSPLPSPIWERGKLFTRLVSWNLDWRLRAFKLGGVFTTCRRPRQGSV